MRANFKSKSLYFKYQALITLITFSTLLSKISCSIQNVLLMIIRESTYTNCQDIRNLSRSYFIVDQYMVGSVQTSTHVVTRKVPPSPYIRSKMGIALAASPMLSGHLMAITLLILLPCSSTSLKKGPSPASFLIARFVAGVGTDLALVGLNYLQDMHHLMVKKMLVS